MIALKLLVNLIKTAWDALMLMVMVGLMKQMHSHKMHLEMLHLNLLSCLSS